MPVAATKVARASVLTNPLSAHVGTKDLRRGQVFRRAGTIRFRLARATVAKNLAMTHVLRLAKRATISRGRMNRSRRGRSLTTLVTAAARLIALLRSDLPMAMRQPVPTKALAVVQPKARVASSQRVLVQVDSAAELRFSLG